MVLYPQRPILLPASLILCSFRPFSYGLLILFLTLLSECTYFLTHWNFIFIEHIKLNHILGFLPPLLSLSQKGRLLVPY